MIIVSLILTVFVYLIFPCAYVGSVGKVPAPQAKKYALINSIIGALIFIIINVALGAENAVGAGGFAPAVLYYFIAKAILTEKEPEQIDNNPQAPSNDNQDNNDNE